MPHAQQAGRQFILEVRENTVRTQELQANGDLPEGALRVIRSLPAR